MRRQNPSRNTGKSGMPIDSREIILRRIREALRLKAPPRHLAGAQSANNHPVTDWLPPVPKEFDELLTLFEKNCMDLRTEIRHCVNRANLATELAALGHENGWRTIATHNFALGNQAITSLGLPTTFTDQPYESTALERCDAAISGCDCLIAQTGSIMVTAASAGGRALSVFPPHHVVIATRSQLVENLADAFAIARKKHINIPAFLSFITGPSRTGDIERILVLGAHGPKKLTVILIGE